MRSPRLLVQLPSVPIRGYLLEQCPVAMTLIPLLVTNRDFLLLYVSGTCLDLLLYRFGTAVLPLLTSLGLVSFQYYTGLRLVLFWYYTSLAWSSEVLKCLRFETCST